MCGFLTQDPSIHMYVDPQGAAWILGSPVTCLKKETQKYKGQKETTGYLGFDRLMICKAGQAFNVNPPPTHSLPKYT